MWLTETQIEKLTRKVRHRAQIRVLEEACIPHRVVDGRPIVLERDLAPTAQGHDNERPRLRLYRKRA